MPILLGVPNIVNNVERSPTAPVRNHNAVIAPTQQFAETPREARAVVDAVGEGLQVIQKKREEVERKDAIVFSNDAINRLSVKGNELLQENKTIEDINQYTVKFKEGLQKAYDEEKEKAPSETARLALNQQYSDLNAKFTVAAASFQASEKVDRQVQTSVSSVNALSNMVIQNPGSFDIAKQGKDNAIAALSTLMPASQVEKYKRAFNNDIYAARVKSIVDTNPWAAEKLLKDKDSIANIDNREYLSLENGIIHSKDRIERKQKEAQEAQEMQQAINNVAASIKDPNIAAYIDPRDAKNQKAVDALFKTSGLVEGLQSLNPQAMEQTVMLVGRSGMLPSSAAGVLRGLIVNGNKTQQIYAAQMIGRIAELEKPGILTGIGQDSIDKSLMIKDAIRAGATPDDAYNTVNEAFKAKDKGARELLQTKFKEDFPNDYNYRADIEAHFSEWFGFDPKFSDAPVISNKLEADFRALVKLKFMQTGNAESAKKLAMNTFTQTVGVTNITGRKEITKYAPEKYYALEGVDNEEWMQEDLRLKVEKNKETITKLTGRDDVNIKDDVFLIPTYITNNAAGALSPIYQVLVKSKDGGFIYLQNDKGNVYYTPSYQNILNKQKEELPSSKTAAERKEVHLKSYIEKTKRREDALREVFEKDY